MGSRLGKERKVGGVFHLKKPFPRVDVVDAQILKTLVEELMGREHLVVMVMLVFGDVFGIDLFFSRLQQHKQVDTQCVKDLLRL